MRTYTYLGGLMRASSLAQQVPFHTNFIYTCPTNFVYLQVAVYIRTLKSRHQRSLGVVPHGLRPFRASLFWIGDGSHRVLEPATRKPCASDKYTKTPIGCMPQVNCEGRLEFGAYLQRSYRIFLIRKVREGNTPRREAVDIILYNCKSIGAVRDDDREMVIDHSGCLLDFAV